VRALASSRVTLKKKRRIVLQCGRFISSLIYPAIATIGSLLAGKLTSLIWIVGLSSTPAYPWIWKMMQKSRWRYDVGDSIRIAATHHLPFAKRYTAKWMRELFEITARLPTTPMTYIQSA